MTPFGFGSDAPAPNEFITRRAWPRRETDRCVAVVNGRTMPVMDWSLGGARIFGDAREFTQGAEIDIIMRFQTDDGVMNVAHRAHVVRKAAENFSLQFLPLDVTQRHAFQTVIDRFNAAEFANSQA
jgi:hypothetical protein